MTVPTLIGREPLLADLAHLVRRVREHGSLLALLTGPRRAGRTAVLDALAAGHPGRVRRATAVSWEAGRPGAVLAQLTGGTPWPRQDPLQAAEALVAGLTAEAAAGSEPEPDPGDVVVALVDDAHLSDPESLRVLGTAVRHHPDARLLVLLTAPSDPARTPGPDVADVLESAPVVRLTVDPLDIEGVRRLAAARGVPLTPWVAERMHRHTGGLPGAVVALLTELPAETWLSLHPDLPAPAAVAARVHSALEDLPVQARRLCEAASILGGDRSLATAARLAEVTEIWPAVDAAVAAGLLHTDGPAGGPRLRPVDRMVAAALRATLGPARRAALHLRAAELIADPTTAMRHRVAATPTTDPALADELEDLAERRAAEGAWSDAAALLTDASRLTEDRLKRQSRLTRAVDALVGAGEGQGAAALVPELESLGETPLRNAVLGYLAILRGRATEAETRLARAWELVDPDRDPATAGLICQRYVLHSLVRGRWSELVSWADRAIGLVGPEDPAAVESAAIRGLGLVAGGWPDEAVAAYHDLGQRVRRGAQAQRIRLGSGWLYLALDEVDEARADLESAVPTGYLGGSARISLWARAWLARVQFLTGEWDQALATVADARAGIARSGIVLARTLLDWTEVEVHALRGDWDTAQEVLRAAEAAPQDYATMGVPTALARAALAEARADHEGVIRALTPLTVARLTEAVAEPGFFPWVSALASALATSGRYDEADALLAPHEERAARLAHRSTGARLARARGRLEAARGDLDAARRAFEPALETLEGLPLRVERAHTVLAYGQVLRRAGKRREADALLTSARDDYAALGATTLVDRCDRELKAGGVRVARPERAPADLTPQEEAVTDLVVRGLSNREVAAQLFLSPKTVQYHLTRVYAKLGVRSRTELAASLGSTPGDDSA